MLEHWLPRSFSTCFVAPHLLLYSIIASSPMHTEAIREHLATAKTDIDVESAECSVRLNPPRFPSQQRTHRRCFTKFILWGIGPTLATIDPQPRSRHQESNRGGRGVRRPMWLESDNAFVHSELESADGVAMGPGIWAWPWRPHGPAM